MDSITNARRLGREQTREEKELWRDQRAGRFAGFKFRRQHPVDRFHLDYSRPPAKLSTELDGFQHGWPEQGRHDAERAQSLQETGIEELRFWKHQWQKNREGVWLEVWHALHRRTGCVVVVRQVENQRYVPPRIEQLKEVVKRHGQQWSPLPPVGGEGEESPFRSLPTLRREGEGRSHCARWRVEP